MIPVVSPFRLIKPGGAARPILLDSPHSGRSYAADFSFDCDLSRLRQLEDPLVDELIIDAAGCGATVLCADFPRAMIDVNRAEDDIDPAVIDGDWPYPLAPDPVTPMGFGLIRRMVRSGEPLYRQPLPVAEIQRRITTYYQRYHMCLRACVRQQINDFGRCLFLDMHSMPGRNDNGGLRPDIILGNRNGASCAVDVLEQIAGLFQNMGYSVVLNYPYQGREIIRRHGLEGSGANAVQIEINRRLYLDEKTGCKHQGFDKLRDDLMALVKII